MVFWRFFRAGETEDVRICIICSGHYNCLEIGLVLKSSVSWGIFEVLFNNCQNISEGEESKMKK